MKLRLLTEDATMIPRLRAALKGVKGDNPVIWYNPDEARAFVSVGDWADPDPWVEAIAPLVGKDNIECESESGPSGPGWVLVRDTHRIKDNFGELSPQRRLELGMDEEAVTEAAITPAGGSVGAARGQIMATVNDIAKQIGRRALRIFQDPALSGRVKFERPQVEFTDSEDNPAVVTLRLGGGVPETISVTVHGDGVGETKLEMSERLSKLLGLPRHATTSSLREVDAKLSEVVAVMKQKLRRPPANVQGVHRAQVGGPR